MNVRGTLISAARVILHYISNNIMSMKIYLMQNYRYVYRKTSIMNKHDDTIITKMKTPLQAISRKNVRNG